MSNTKTYLVVVRNDENEVVYSAHVQASDGVTANDRAIAVVESRGWEWDEATADVMVPPTTVDQ